MLANFLSTREIQLVEEHGFSSQGLRYTLDQLNEVRPSQKTMQEMSEYVDAVTFAKVHSDDLSFLLPMLQPPTQTVNISTTGLGNVAYVAIHCLDPLCREKARTLYELLVAVAK
jgi:hypothetical protein